VAVSYRSGCHPGCRWGRASCPPSAVSLRRTGCADKSVEGSTTHKYPAGLFACGSFRRAGSPGSTAGQRPAATWPPFPVAPVRHRL